MPSLPDPPLLLITDRRQAPHPLMDTVTAALEGGCRWISLREKDLPLREQIALAQAIAEAGRPFGARIMIHGSAYLAQRAGLDAVHLPAFGDIEEGRLLFGHDGWVSKSTHDLDEARRAAASGANAVTLSPIFASASKPGYGPPIGLDALETVAASLTIPVIALGGIDATRARSCLARGAEGIAVMGEVMRASAPARTVADLVAGLDLKTERREQGPIVGSSRSAGDRR